MSSSTESSNEKSVRRKRITSPCRNAKSLLKPVLSPAKDGKNSKCSSPSTSSGSIEDNDTSTQNSSMMTNGLSTVSKDGKTKDISKTAKSGPGGRLKFFKDGVLCLELSHQGEGERTKWVQIKTKTVVPAIIHTTKEATIPCQFASSAFSSPTAAHSLRVESSTSHSMSDDGSSMLSSPRDRESTWKQTAPVKGVSASHEFFMNPAPCILKYRRKLQVEAFFKFRRPYARMPQIDKMELVCSCGDIGVKSEVPNGDAEEANDETDFSMRDVLTNKKCSGKKTTECSLGELVKKLACVAESRKEMNLNDSNSESKPSPLKTQLATPKKRVCKDAETRDSNFRPKMKKSPTGSHEKTILTIPGLNSEFYKRHISTVTNDLPSSSTYSNKLDRAGESGCKAVNLTKASSKNKSRLHSSLPMNNSSTPIKNRKSLYHGAKPVSSSKHLLNTQELLNNPLMLNPNQMVESAIPLSSMSGYAGRGNSSHKTKSRSSTSTEEKEKEKEQQLFQQQTMSKAISYTINSLLGAGSVDKAFDSSKTTSSSLYNGNVHSGPKKSNRKSQSPPAKSKLNSKSPNNEHSPTKKRGSFSALENDQNSFLRHLLDTSDPIPSNKNERTAIPIPNNKSLNKSSSSKNNHNSSRNVNNSTSTTSKSATAIKSQSKPVSSSSSRSSSPSHNIIRQSLQSHLLHPMSADASPYSNLFGPTADTAALAAAYYSSLLPAAFLPHLAASPASYLLPNHAMGTASSTPIVPQLLYGNNSILNLSQNIWPGFLPGSPIHPPYAASINDDLRSLSAIQHRNSNSSFYDAHSPERRDKRVASSPIDNDTPLNLCKKNPR